MHMPNIPKRFPSESIMAFGRELLLRHAMVRVRGVDYFFNTFLLSILPPAYSVTTMLMPC